MKIIEDIKSENTENRESSDIWLGKGIKDFIFFVAILFVIFGIATLIDSI